MSLLPVIMQEIIQVSFKARFTKQATYGQWRSAHTWGIFYSENIWGNPWDVQTEMSNLGCIRRTRGFIFHVGNVQGTVLGERSGVFWEWGIFHRVEFFMLEMYRWNFWGECPGHV